MAHSSTPQWEAPKFSFNAEDQASAWREVYTRAIDYLETLDIDPEREDENKKGMEADKNDVYRRRKDKHYKHWLTITPEDQLTPMCALKAIQTTIKEEEHYWHYRDKMMSDIRQQPNEQFHTEHQNHYIS